MFLRGFAILGVDGKAGQIKFSKGFNDVIKDSKINVQSNEHWLNEWRESDFNFFKTYFSLKEFFEDIAFEKNKSRHFENNHWVILSEDAYVQRELKQFFAFYEGKDFTDLHLKLDSPILMTLFQEKNYKYGNLRHDYEFLINPNLYELDFAKAMPGEILLQELEMFLGNVLVKDVMPQCFQSDIDKIVSHGFDPKTSFRK